MLIIPEPTNQLCNRLFVFAHVIAFCMEHQTAMTHLAFEEYAPFFKTTARDAFCRYPARRSLVPATPRGRSMGKRAAFKLLRSLRAGRLRRLGGGRIRTIHSGWETNLVASGGAVMLDSDEFLQTWKREDILLLNGPIFRAFSYFQKYESALRDYFAPLDVHCNAVEELIAKERAECDVLIGVHVRQGDYRTFVDGRYFFTAPQYASVMRTLVSQLPGKRARFLLSSNEKQDAADYAGLNVGMSTGHMIQDLHALARCDYMIGPPSTFSAWASFYGQVPLAFIQDPETPLPLENFAINHG